jgi:predicted CoA-binding protein
MTEIRDIEAFLACKRVAVVGVSRNARDFTRTLFREFQHRGYDAVPVNPAASEVEGVPCFASVGDVRPGAEAALLLTPAAAVENLVKECAAAGIRQVWMYRATGTGAVNPAAVEFCRANGLRVVAGECPFMFFPGTGLVHRVHGFCRKMVGRYPR